MLRGAEAVFESYAAIFSGPGRNQFVLTDQVVHIEGDVAWVSLDENLLEVAATVTTINVFVRSDAEWKLVAHHGSPVMGR